jgi:probable phosphoglycerate mutase
MPWYFVRHAEKADDPRLHPSLGRQDPPLSAAGRRAAEALARRLAHRPIAAIWVSEFQRTQQTAECLATRLGLRPAIDARLNEFSNGVAEAMTEAEFRQAYAAEWRAFAGGAADFRWPGGETGAEAQARIVDFVQETLPRYADQDILVVSHDGLLRLWMCHVLGRPVYQRGDFQVDYGGLIEMQYRPETERWKLIRLNWSPQPRSLSRPR